MRAILIAGLLATTPVAAQAIVAATSGLTNPAYVETFGANLYPNFTPVSTEFPPLVVTHASYFTTAISNNLVGGFLTNDFAAGQPNTLRVQFLVPVIDVSFVYDQIGTSQPSTIRALFQGAVVDTFSGTWNQSQANNYFGFANTLLDELQVDFVGDFNVDTFAMNPIGPVQAQCVFANGSGVNPADFACATLPVLGATWQGTIATGPNTVATLLAYSDAGLLPAPAPLFGGELLIDPSAGVVTFSGLGNYSLSIPSAGIWIGSAVTFQGLRVELSGGSVSLVPLNANQLILGL